MNTFKIGDVPARALRGDSLSLPVRVVGASNQGSARSSALFVRCTCTAVATSACPRERVVAAVGGAGAGGAPAGGGLHPVARRRKSRSRAPPSSLLRTRTLQASTTQVSSANRLPHPPLSHPPFVGALACARAPDNFRAQGPQQGFTRGASLSRRTCPPSRGSRCTPRSASWWRMGWTPASR